MKTFSLLLTLLVSLCAVAQEQIPAPADFTRIQVGLLSSADVSYRTLKYKDGTLSSALILSDRNRIERPRVTYSAGLSFYYHVNAALGLSTGIQYATMGYQSGKQQVQFAPASPDYPTARKYVDAFHYIQIPLKANYSFGKKKLRLMVGAGVIGAVVIKAQETRVQYFAGKTERRVDDVPFSFRRVNVLPTFSLGVDYKINSRMNFRVEPTIRYGLLPIFDAPITANLYSTGLSFSYFVGL